MWGIFDSLGGEKLRSHTVTSNWAVANCDRLDRELLASDVPAYNFATRTNLEVARCDIKLFFQNRPLRYFRTPLSKRLTWNS